MNWRRLQVKDVQGKYADQHITYHRVVVLYCAQSKARPGILPFLIFFLPWWLGFFGFLDQIGSTNNP